MPDKFLTTSNEESLAKFKSKPWVRHLIHSSGQTLKLYESLEVRIVYLVIDCSTSMSERDKMPQAKRGTMGFAYEAREKGYVIGLISFASFAKHLADPRNDLSGIKCSVEAMYADGSTNMTEAIRLATKKLVRLKGEKVICLVTDGQPDDQEEVIKAAEEAKLSGIEIMAIGTDDADIDFLDKLVTRQELSKKIEVVQLEVGIVSMANLLPDKRHEYRRLTKRR